MRLGFDLHDGPIQDVLGAGRQTSSSFRRQVYPFILEDYPRAGARRASTTSPRGSVELDRQLREIAHSLETKSVISAARSGRSSTARSTAFAERTGIASRARDPRRPGLAVLGAAHHRLPRDSGGARERARARERDHASVRVRARRSAIELQIVDDGMGFEVERALAKAAQRGRLGLVGIGERVRMVGRHASSSRAAPAARRRSSSRSPAGSRSRR